MPPRTAQCVATAVSMYVPGTQLGVDIDEPVVPGWSKLPRRKFSPTSSAGCQHMSRAGCADRQHAAVRCALEEESACIEHSTLRHAALCCAVLCLYCSDDGHNTCTDLNRTDSRMSVPRSACITQPGCGFQPADGSASVCMIGSYSSGNNQQPCTPCPAGLTTSAAKSESVSACMAPPGYFFQV